MKQLLTSIALLLICAPLFSAETLDTYDDLLDRYVVENSVRYDAWRGNEADRNALAEVVATLESTDPASLDEAARYALYINLYNAKTLKVVLDGNPETSIRNLSKKKFGFGIFFKKLIQFEGQSISLDDLEDRLRAESADPRVHFAVNCASRSCPALLGKAFRGERLEEQLEQQSYAFLRRDDAILVEERPGGPPLVRLSKIFDWYAKDFGGSAGVRQFVRKYAPEELQPAVAGGFRVSHLNYDWTLNRAD